MFIDTHSHIHFRKEFPDFPDVLARAKVAGVGRQIIVGCTVKDSLLALEFVKEHLDFSLWSTLGVHPHNADQLTDEVLEQFRGLALSEDKIVAVGEMGLDYFRNFRAREVQLEAFERQLLLAVELDLPVVVHVRDAWDDALDLLKRTANKKVVLHCFTGTMAHAETAWKTGYYTSFSGVITYPKNEELREVVKAAPADLMLLETDCPYLTPQPYRGKRNEPAYVVETAREVSDVRGVALEEVGELTTKNAVKLFGIE